jgi:hypothetical protein
VMVAGRWFDRAALDQGLLADPKAWVRAEIVKEGIMPFQPQNWMHTEARSRLERLADSLAEVPPADPVAYGRVVRQLTETLGALREHLTPEQRRTSFDPTVRVWMREQARRGHRVTVAGVALTPTP